MIFIKKYLSLNKLKLLKISIFNNFYQIAKIENTLIFTLLVLT